MVQAIVGLLVYVLSAKNRGLAGREMSTRSLDQVVSNSDIATPSRRAQEQEPAAIRSAKTAERFGMSRRRFLQ